MIDTARPPVTLREQELLDFIGTFGRLRGFAPTVREIGEGTGLRSSSTVHNHLVALARKGYLVHNPHQARTLTLIDADAWLAIQAALEENA